MRSLLFAFVALIVGCSSAPVQKDDSHPSLLGDFQFIQNGKAVQPNNGVVRLNRSEFYIRHTRKGQRPSVFASFNPKVKEQFQSLRDPLVTWDGTGIAASPSELFVDDGTLQLYEGWSSVFEKDFGKMLGAKTRAEFDVFRKQLPTEPLLITSGSNYANFVPQSDGSSVYVVSQINDKAFPSIGHTYLYLVLFADDVPFGSGISQYLLHWTPVVIEFTDHG